LSSLTFASTHVVWLLFAAALMGALISTSVGGGAFLALEQAILAQNVVDTRRTLLFVFYSLVGSLSAAFGGLFSGVAGRVFPGDQAEMAYKTLFLLAALLGASNLLIFRSLSARVERLVAPVRPASFLGV